MDPASTHISLKTPQMLPVRLERSTPSLGCTFSIGALLTLVAAGIFFATRHTAGEKTGWLPYIISSGFGFFGLLILGSFFRQLLMTRLPAIIVEVSEQPFVLGRAAKIALIQPGPAELFSLRASLICLEQHITLLPRKGGSSGVTRTDREVKEKMIHTQNLVDEEGLRVFAGETWTRTVEFTVPADGLASKETEKHVILWRIEVWGKGRFLASFMHPYNVQVIEKKNNGTAELGK